MAKKKIPSWLVGCGIGCAVPVVLCLGLFGGGIYYINRLAGGVDQAIETRGVLNERFGEPVDYVPAADGAVPAERMETFLAVRRSLQPLCVVRARNACGTGPLDSAPASGRTALSCP